MNDDFGFHDRYDPMNADSPLDHHLQDRVQAELRPGEKLIWSGQPRPSRMARQAWPIVLFGIPFTAFAIFWMAGASGLLFGGFGGGAGNGIKLFSLIFPLFGIPFVLVGLGMLSAPYWIGRQARRTIYALTDRRAILWQAGWRGTTEVRSYMPEQLTKLRRVEYGDGNGDLIFEETITHGRDSDGDRTTHVKRYGFMAIDNVRQVEEKLQETLLANREC